MSTKYAKSFMIKRFKHKGLKKLFKEDDRSKVNPEHAEKLLDLLDRLDASKKAEDMRFPGSGFHQLENNRKVTVQERVEGEKKSPVKNR